MSFGMRYCHGLVGQFIEGQSISPPSCSYDCTHDRLPYGTVHFGTVHCGTVHFGTVHCGTVHCGTVHFGTVHVGAVIIVGQFTVGQSISQPSCSHDCIHDRLPCGTNSSLLENALLGQFIVSLYPSLVTRAVRSIPMPLLQKPSASPVHQLLSSGALCMNRDNDRSL